MSANKTGPSFLSTGGASHSCTKGRKNMQANKQFTSFTPMELKNLMDAAQRLDDHAIARLCAAFKPLIVTESHKRPIIAKLGEDSENIAWEIFLDALQRYQGNKYHLLPGLIQKQLHFELLHRAYPRTNISVTADYLLGDLDTAESLSVSRNTNVDDLLNKKFFADIFRYLTKRQRDIIDALYLHQMSLAEYCTEQRITYTAAYTLERRALAKLKQLLTKEVFTKVNTKILERARRKSREKQAKRERKKNLL